VTGFSIDGVPVGDRERPYVVAEVGINARDDLELAKAFVEVAADEGADAVKFQTHLPDEEMARSAMAEADADEVYDVVSGNVLSEADHVELQAHCRDHGVTFLSTPFSAAAVDRLDDLDVPAIKIGSGELTNRELLARAADTGKPLIVSTGMSEWETVRDAVAFLESRDATVALLYCVSAYPADPEQFNLGLIQRMRDAFDVPVGFSDHSLGVDVAALAMANGAAIVEKHFTIDRRLPGPDQEVSIEPEELRELVAFADLVDATRGDEKPVHDDEAAVKSWANHSLVSAAPIEAGERLDEDNLTTKRPGTGVSAERYFDVLGTAVARDVPADTVLTDEDLAE
jgi:N-acetylneuraminate synthase/N,N'-diacetyllegionaminate synthase